MKISEVKPKVFVFPGGDKHEMKPHDIIVELGAEKLPVENPPVSNMTLRDFFAGMALSGLLANQIYGEKIEEGFIPDYEYLTSTAYTFADGMLVTRDYGY